MICADFKPLWNKARRDALASLIPGLAGKLASIDNLGKDKLSYPPRLAQAEHYLLMTILAYMNTRPTALVEADGGSKRPHEPLGCCQYCTSKYFLKTKGIVPYHPCLCDGDTWLLQEDQFAQCATALRHFMEDLSVPKVYTVVFLTCRTTPAKKSICIEGDYEHTESTAKTRGSSKRKSNCSSSIDLKADWWFLKYWKAIPDTTDSLTSYCLYDLVPVDESKHWFA